MPICPSTAALLTSAASSLTTETIFFEQTPACQNIKFVDVYVDRNKQKIFSVVKTTHRDRMASIRESILENLLIKNHVNFKYLLEHLAPAFPFESPYLNQPRESARQTTIKAIFMMFALSGTRSMKTQTFYQRNTNIITALS